MDLKDFFEKHPEINQAAVAKMVWDNVKYPNTKLANKLSNIAGQRITDKDVEAFRAAFKRIAKDLNEF